jgi:hypothetical protein
MKPVSSAQIPSTKTRSSDYGESRKLTLRSPMSKGGEASLHRPTLPEQ